MKHTGLIVAAGKGLRTGGDIPKQFMKLKEMPLLYYSLKAMQDSFIDEIIVVTSSDYMDHVKREIVEKYAFSKVKSIVSGGKERSDSVYAGLKAIDDPENTYVYIHDGARPMLSPDILERARDGAIEFGAVIAAVKSKDTVKLAKDGVVTDTPDRDGVFIVQTPQVFKADAIIKAYDAMFAGGTTSLTDDAGVMERFGELRVHIIEGDYSNIKVTTPEDFKIVERLL